MRNSDQKMNEKSLDKATIHLPEKDPPNSVVEIKFLATSWLDDFEKKIFKGKTVNQILNPQRYE